MNGGHERELEQMDDGTMRSPRWQREVWCRQQHLITVDFAERILAVVEAEEDRELSAHVRPTTPRGHHHHHHHATSPRDEHEPTSPRAPKKGAKLRVKDIMRRSKAAPAAVSDQDQEAFARRRRGAVEPDVMADRIVGQVLAYARFHNSWQARAEPERES
jgi:hypothetical protein